MAAAVLVFIGSSAFGQDDESAPKTVQLPKPPPPQGGPIPRQEQNEGTQNSAPNERWNLFWQATSIGQYHGAFSSPYADPRYSLQNYPERDVSLTTTLFFGLRLDQNTQLYLNPEIAGGRGFSGVTGLANSSNGELPRVASATPKPYLARLYLSHDFGFGNRKESFDSEVNQLGGQRPLIRYTITLGRFTLTDFFDNNRYSHDPRTQFMGWAVMFNGSWDYPADVRGYTWGWVHEFHTSHWSFRYGSGAMPRVANGLRFDRRVLRDRGDVFEVEKRHEIRKHPGTVRVLGYANHADAGTYAEAIQLAKQTGTAPDVTGTRHPGTLKYGFAINADQEITSDIGVFSRLSWNDGKTESFAFTAIDRLATGGVSMTGQRWRRPFDTGATELTASGLSGVHASYLAMGGHDFLLGDGRLQYAPEYVWESYYSARLFPGFFASLDYQHVANPAFNQDRGPVSIYSIRLHWELGKEDFRFK
jgi:high affinity Mn2+ porin